MTNIKQGLSLIIPVFNEEKTIELIIKRCHSLPLAKQLIVVNDGSKDKTKSVLGKISKKYPSVTIIHHQTNLGKGMAIKTGLSQALGKYVLVQDADLEYYPEEIVRLYEKAEGASDGIVFGNRSANKQKGYILAQLGNWYLNLLFFSLFGLQLQDSYTCYKLIPRKIWQRINLQSNGFEIDAELVSKLGREGYKIIEVPISYHPRKYSEGKKINWIDVIWATKVAFKIRFFTKKDLYE